MTKQKTLLLIPLVLVGGLLAYTWTHILSREIATNWRHITATILYILLVVLFFKNRVWATLGMGVFFLLGVCSLGTFMPYIATMSIGIGPVATPPFNGLSVLLFLFYFILNLNPLIDIQIGYSERKKQKERERKAGEQ